MHGRCFFVCVLFALVCVFASAQDKTPNQVRDVDQVDSGVDQQAARELWFRDGRTSANPNVPAAEMLRRAQQQRQQLRARRNQRAATSSGFAATAINSTWQLLGPAPMVSSDDPSNFQDYGNVSGRVTAVAIDQSDASGNTVYVGAAYGGVWRSTNAAGPAGSVTWTPLTDDQATLAVGAIAVSPDGNTLLVGTGEPNNAGDSYYGLGILLGTTMKTAPTFTMIAGTAEGVSFRGVGFAHFAWNTTTPTNVVASVANTSKNNGSNPKTTSVGLFFSNDSGATWHQASVKDGGSPVSTNSITGLVYNPLANNGTGAYFAAVRSHGFFTSTDNGATWTRLTAQPGAINPTNCPPAGAANALTTCPLYRGEIAVTPGKNEMFAWYVDVAENNQSIWISRDGGGTWSDLTKSGQMAACGDAIGGTSAGCDTEQGTYNLELAAVPTANGTDVYAGAVNIFKCSVPATDPVGTCNWLNTTHAYGCFPHTGSPHVHPDQHGIDFLRTTPDVMVFGNDGGVYRSLSASAGIVSGTCGQANSYDNINGNLALTQFVWFSHDPTADQILVGGTQDNGSPSLNPTVANAAAPQLWTNYLGGDGGYTAIDPTAPSNWYLSQPFTDIFRSAAGVNTRGTLNSPTITAAALGGDQGAFYTPFMLDPAAPSKILVGTCRVWRGSASGGVFTALSTNFSTLTAAKCDSTQHTTIRALAAGGLSTTNGSQVIYAGTSAAVRPGQGKVFVTENADGGVTTWHDRTGTINPQAFQISSIVVDSNDLSGRTAFVTIMGFGGGHLFRTTDAGVNWTNVTGDLPDAPADSFAIDPGDPSVWYVATDTGVYISTNGGTNWTEYGPVTGSGFLPNVAPTHLEAISTGNTKKLRVSTYGRGIWQVDLNSASVAATDFSVAPSGAATQTVSKGESANYALAVGQTNGFAGTVSLACAAGLPAGATCSFTPASVAPGGTTTLTIKTAASGSSQQARLTIQRLWYLALLLPGVVWVGIPRRRRGLLLMLALTLATVLFLSACGGGGASSSAFTAAPPPPPPATPAGTSTVIVTATSGFVVHSTQVTLTVQ